MVAREQEADGRTLAGPRCRVRSGSLRTSCQPGPMARTATTGLTSSESIGVTGLRQLVEQRLGVLEVGGVEALGEPAVDRGEEVVSLRAFALIGPQSGKAG